MNNTAVRPFCDRSTCARMCWLCKPACTRALALEMCVQRRRGGKRDAGVTLVLTWWRRRFRSTCSNFCFVNSVLWHQSLSCDLAQCPHSCTREPTVEVAVPYGFLHAMLFGFLPSPPATDSSPARVHILKRADFSRVCTDTDARARTQTRTRACLRTPCFCCTMHLLCCAALPARKCLHRAGDAHRGMGTHTSGKTSWTFSRRSLCALCAMLPALASANSLYCSTRTTTLVPVPRSAKAQMQKHKTTCAHVA